MKNKKGFTLVEAIVSIAIISAVSVGFMLVITGNARILARGQQIDRSSYEDVRLIENREGEQDMTVTLKFKTDAQGINGSNLQSDFKIYRYHVVTEENKMYYFDAE